jgi:hypothetical protein
MVLKIRKRFSLCKAFYSGGLSEISELLPSSDRHFSGAA